jgi:hypothetical protein
LNPTEPFYVRYLFDRVENTAILVGVGLIVFLALEVIDRFTESPVMQTRVNEASDRFLAERGTIWQAAVRSTRALLRHDFEHWL